MTKAGAKKFNRSLVTTVKSLTVLSVSLLVSLLLLELGVRIYAVIFFPRLMVIDDKLGWRHAVNASKTYVNEFGEQASVVLNEHGHRGRDYGSTVTPPGSFRILVLGDSFTEGVHVGEADLFTAQLESANPNLQVINAGVGGYGTVQEYLYLASEGLKLYPNLVVLMFYENDLSDNLLSYYPGFGPRPYAAFNGDKLKIVDSLDSSEYEKFILPVPFRMFLNRHSYFYHFVNSRIYQPLSAGRMRQMQQTDMRKFDTATRHKTFYAVLEKLHSLLAMNKVDLLVVMIPAREDVASGRSPTIEGIGEFCRSRGIDCLSLVDKFRRETVSGAQLYFPEDIHWTKAGHKAAADGIREHIQRRREIDGRGTNREHLMRNPIGMPTPAPSQ